MIECRRAVIRKGTDAARLYHEGRQMRTINTVDLFCGAGGATTGLELALKRHGMEHKGIAINHWRVAVETMKANHPAVNTMQMNIEDAIPEELVPGRVVDLLWASPSCTHHSRAKGGKPRSNQLRAQPSLILQWLDDLYVRRIIVENVPEFVDWGPLTKDGKPIERLKGSCFRAWIEEIKARNYTVEWRVVNCADYGDATSRRRFFLKAVRRGCGKIRWPEPTHEENPQPGLFGTLKPWRGVRECLDLSDTGRSIFNRRKPLARNTLRRISVGLRKFCGLDFQMDMLGAGENDETRVLPTSKPLRTQHTANRTAIVRPFVVRMNRNCDAESIDGPLSTTTTKEHHALCSPLVLGQQGGATARPISKPCPTIATGGAVRMITPLVLGRDACAQCRPATKPMPTLTCGGAMRGIFPVLEDGRVIDIRIRMLKPSELAAAHSFPADYKLTGNRGEQVKQIGNSVPVETAAAMCAADLEERKTA